MPPGTPCPSAELLRRSLDPAEPMSDGERQRIETHVDACDRGCKEVVAALLRGDPLLGDPEATRPVNAPDSSSAPGTAVQEPLRPQPAPPPMPGYEVLEELGRGGMGIVYKARQAGLDRVVALKMILAGSHASQEDLARFKCEAEAVARLQHPHIVQIHEIGEHNGLPFFSLEFCPGGSLAAQLDGAPQPPRRAAGLVETLAQAMHAAHQQQIVHRDLKPANVLLAADGTPKISDFGLAKKLDAAGQTQSGSILGTPSYMAPEQAGGKAAEVGPATDIYALGAILYELLTGRPPFRAATPLDTVLQVRSEEPVPPRRLQSRVPADLETICLKCLHKEPRRRYATALSLADDLRRFQAGEPIRARPVGAVERTWKWARRRPALAALLGAVLLALVSLAVLSGNLVAARHDADEKRKDAERKELLAREKEAEARKEADKARKASDFLVRILELSDARTQTSTLTPRQILDAAEKRIPHDFADQPELQAEVQEAIDRVYAKITQNAPLAMLLEVRGTVQLQSSRDPRPQPVPQVLLYAGDRLRLADDAQVRLVVLSDLHQEQLCPGSDATLHRKGCEPAEAIGERSEDILMTFVRLPKGTFYMGWGSELNDPTSITKGRKTEVPAEFEIAVHDVTQGQWQAVMGENPSYFSRFGGGRNEVKSISDEELKLFPVEGVSWDDVQAFLKKLNENERGRGYWYRLPTELEWEYACRGGATSEEECSYHFYFDKPTNDLSSGQANFNGSFPFGKAPKGAYLGRTTRVGAYPSNRLGLCDMHGNVWQWTDTAEGSDLVNRGGSWGIRGTGCQAASRTKITPTFRSDYLGFRLARVPVR